jgi:hypothetical protein
MPGIIAGVLTKEWVLCYRRKGEMVRQITWILHALIRNILNLIYYDILNFVYKLKLKLLYYLG